MNRALWLPPSPFLGILLRRAALLWFLCRITLLMLGGLDYVHPELPTSIGLTVLVAILTLLDARRRHETILMGNFGIGTDGLLATGAAPPIVLEVAAWLLVP